MVLWCFLCINAKWYAYGCLFSLLCICFKIGWMYDFMLNVWNLRERERKWVSIVSLPKWEFPARSAVKSSARSALTEVQSLSLKDQERYCFSHFRRSAGEAHKPCKVCAGWLKSHNLSTKGWIVWLMLQKGAQSQEFKYLKVFEGFSTRRACRSIFKDSKLQRKIRRGSTI
jgi:hypothetical protein